jgi:protein SCO1/2
MAVCPLRRSTGIALALGALGVFGGLAGCDKGTSPAADGTAGGSFRAVDITGADYAQELGLPDADGKVRTLAEFRGKVVVVFFGFTHCPDVCPTTLAEIATVRQALGADGARVQAVFVTVDPERDTPELLRSYVGGFGTDFVALRGTPEQTAALARSFKVFYAKAPGKTPDTYTVDHTAGSYVFDTRGRVRLFTRYGTGVEALTADLRRLLAEG